MGTFQGTKTSAQAKRRAIGKASAQAERRVTGKASAQTKRRETESKRTREKGDSERESKFRASSHVLVYA